MLQFPHILLARGDDDGGGWVGILFFLVPFILWAIGTIAQKMNQKQAEERRRRLREMMEQSPTGMPPAPMRPEPAPPPPMRPTHVGPMPVPPPKRPKPAPVSRRVTSTAPPPRPKPLPVPPKRAPRQPRRPTAAPPDEALILPETPIAVSRPQPPIEQDAIVTEKPKSVRAQAILQCLKPGTLRQQFILTELFQPPLALRPPRDEML